MAFKRSFSKPPGHFVIIDVGHPMTDQSKRKIISCLKSVILLAGRSNGQLKIPAFGIATMNASYTICRSISSVKQDLNEILKCFDDLIEKEVNGTKITLDNYSSELFKAVQNVMKDCTLQSEKVKFKDKVWLSWPSQIQITLVTAKKASPIMDIFFEIVNELNKSMSKLKQIAVVEIKPEDELTLSNVIHKNGFISHTSISDSSADLDSLFKKWLLESSSDNEHVRIIVNKELDLVVKCDINDVIINPDILPFGHRFKLGNCHCVSIASGIEGSNDLPIYELRVIKRINASSFDTSHTFGNPQRLIPTQCWKLGLNVKNINEELYKSLCFELKQSEVGLLVELEYEANTSNAMTAYFFITTDGESLLLKSIAPMELILPSINGISNNISDETKIFMRKSLEKIPIAENYIAHNFRSNLYSCIEEKSVKQMPPKLSTPLKNKSRVQPYRSSKKKCDEKKDNLDTSMDMLEPGEYVPDFVPKKVLSKIKKSPKKHNVKKILNNCLHPALLSPDMKEALRDRNFSRKFRELGLDLEDAEYLQ